MLVGNQFPDFLAEATGIEDKLLEIYRAKISLHDAKSGYEYPTIRLPHTLSTVAGLSTKIFQTIHEEALAFLVVISPKEKASVSPKTSAFTRRRY
jgi:hypothetical protein